MRNLSRVYRVAGLLALGVPASVSAQQNSNLLNQIRTRDLRTPSVTVLDLIRRDVQGVDGDLRAHYQRLVASELQARGLVTFANDQSPKVIRSDFSASVLLAQKNKENHELTLKLGKQGVMYGVDIVGKGIEVLPGTWGKIGGTFVAPLMQRGVETWLDLNIDDAIKEREAAFGTIVRERFAAYVAEGKSLPAQDQMERVFNEVLGDQLGTDAASRSIMNREALRFTADYLQAHQGEINALSESLKGRQQEIQDLRARTGQQMQQLRKDVEAQVEREIGKVVEGLNTLAVRQNELTVRMDHLSARVSNNEARIHELERTAKTLAANDRQLFDITEEHARLIQQNKVYIDILSSYTFNNLSVRQQITALDSGHFDHIFSPQQKTEIRRDLAVAKTFQDIGTALQVGGDVAGALEAAGILKGQDAVNVAVALEVVSSAVQIGAAFYTGNVAGGISGVMNLVRLGFGGKPQPSPEMQMLQRLDAKLDVLNQNIQVIDTKLTALMEFTEKAFQQLSMDLANHHALVMREFDRIDWKLEHQTRVMNVLLRGDLEMCHRRGAAGNLPATFEEYRDRYDADANFYLDSCLRGLARVSGVNDPYAAVYYEKASGNVAQEVGRQLQYEIRTLYEPAKELFCRYFGLKEDGSERGWDANRALEACLHPQHRPRVATLALGVSELVLPARTQAGRSDIRTQLRAKSSGEAVDPRLALGEMLSPLAVDSISAALLDLFPYFEISTTGASFRPVASAEEYLTQLSDNTRRTRKLNVSRIMESSLRFVNYTLAQQVLLSGAPMLERMYHTLHGVGATDREKELVLQILQNNPIAAHNFGINLMQRVFGVSPNGEPRLCSAAPAEPCFRRLQTLFESIQDSETPESERDARVEDLNAAAAPYGLQFSREGRTLWISHPEWNRGTSEQVKILMPTPDWLVRNEILYPDGVYEMLSLKGTLLDRWIGVNVPEQLGKAAPQTVMLDHYRWLMLQ